MSGQIKSILLLLICLPDLDPLLAQNDTADFISTNEAMHHYFYHEFGYGSEADYNPIYYVINGGFDILQTENQSRNLGGIHYTTGIKNVTYNMSSPFVSIRDYGTRQFLRDEIIPSSFDERNMQWWPNYQLHLIGGGMEYRMIAEWYDSHGFEFPKAASFITIAVQHFLNEVVENNGYVGRTTDPIADLYVFDPLGVLLFSFDPVCRFFGETLNMADWSYQPAYDPTSGNLENAGQNFIFKYRFPFAVRYALFYECGMNGLAGFSHEFEKEEWISLAAGLRNSQNVVVTDETGGRKQTATIKWNAGLFYDKNNSLLFSILASGQRDYQVVANIYPGLFSISRFSPGLFAAFTAGNRIIVGLSLSYSPVGLATGFKRP
ncbi:MAG TPA: hypothetical protein VLX91_15380 [Candidatus Acidoferrales bacterium]|nr:hypothetical protein [Candidatus Acidoferrales bacterium]